MYKDDGLSEHDMLALLRAFPAQTLDFFGALRWVGGPPAVRAVLVQRRVLLDPCWRRFEGVWPRCAPPAACQWLQGFHLRRADSGLDQAGRDPRRHRRWVGGRVGAGTRKPQQGCRRAERCTRRGGGPSRGGPALRLPPPASALAPRHTPSSTSAPLQLLHVPPALPTEENENVKAL